MLTFPDFKEKQIVFVNQSLTQKIHFSNDNLVLKDTQTKKVINRVSCYKIFALFLLGDITLTSVFLRKSQCYGFCIVFLTRNFSFYGILGSQTEGNFLLRSKQYNFTRSLELAKRLVYNKLGNQAQLIQKIRQKTDSQVSAIEVIMRYQEAALQAEDTMVLLGVEGYASKVFFQNYFEKMGWNGRKPRVKHDELNVLLDIGYTFLFNFIECNIRLYGFDIYKGLYHTLFYERKSLVCDLIEPFRCVIDQALYRAYRLKQVCLNDFSNKNNQYYIQYKHINKYTEIFFVAIVKIQNELFHYIQSYYRQFMKDGKVESFPVFKI